MYCTHGTNEHAYQSSKRDSLYQKLEKILKNMLTNYGSRKGEVLGFDSRQVTTKRPKTSFTKTSQHGPNVKTIL